MKVSNEIFTPGRTCRTTSWLSCHVIKEILKLRYVAKNRCEDCFQLGMIIFFVKHEGGVS